MESAKPGKLENVATRARRRSRCLRSSSVDSKPTVFIATMSTESNFSAALATWKGKRWDIYCIVFLIYLLVPEINLSDLQKTLDAQGIEIVENQKESVVGRKSLAERTKGAIFVKYCFCC